jgi:hypothetical protein
MRDSKVDEIYAAGDGSGVPASASVKIEAGKFRMETSVSVTPTALLAVGALTSSILLSTAVLVWSATNVARRRHGPEGKGTR